jgi:chromosomal replication initiator protein
LTFTRFVSTSENRSALLAVQKVAACLCSGREQRVVNPLYLHGPAGTGKTHLVSALVEAVTRQSPQRTVTLLQAADWEARARSSENSSAELADVLSAARQSDLLIVEDLQHWSRRADGSLASLEAFVQLFDHLLAHQQQMVFTATVGPGQLFSLPLRLVSRLGCGLVVRLEALQPASRLALLQDKAQRRQLAVPRDVLVWLASNLAGGVRQLEGALVQLETLARFQPGLLDVDTVATHFREQVEAARPTVERIARRVGGYFRVEPRHLQSRRRYQKILLPRQIGMYLARQLTDLSLEQIGAYFGGRDHSTVLHACRKIEQALAGDGVLAGAVKQLHADLG